MRGRIIKKMKTISISIPEQSFVLIEKTRGFCSNECETFTTTDWSISSEFSQALLMTTALMDFNSLRSSQNDMKNLGSDDMKRAFIAAAITGSNYCRCRAAKCFSLNLLNYSNNLNARRFFVVNKRCTVVYVDKFSLFSSLSIFCLSKLSVS